ncbi:hypothetical protein BGZ80_001699 [Entomortierella chlamydospora]|uniref:DNA/RNA-binding protein Alba-like domain-containing protein n=1 Tax=Entomortierella chlamydospora TaxID=101097 RepID=A0A9P6SXR1_9FUNG|nr:hypothetical protein BGZ79_004902 [Entomortierella chlamydospora]KAG0010188.1 hypothetical protein BGZ80_001699 [Entomortierella chlamydospora]
MENYHRRPKATKSKFEDDNDSETAGAGASKTNKQHNAPLQHGVMVISPNGKIRTYVARALEILTEADSPESQDSAEPTSEKVKTATIPSQNQKATQGQQPQSTTSSNRSNKTRGVLTIKAQGRSITKAVTVAEILKRRMEGSLHQFTEIGQITEQEIWDPNPDVPNLDPLTVSRHRPTIRIRLSKHLDTPSSSSSSSANTSGLLGVDPNMPGASIPRDEHADDDEEDDGEGEAWPGAILDRDAAARRFVGYQAPTGNDIYL